MGCDAGMYCGWLTDTMGQILGVKCPGALPRITGCLVPALGGHDVIAAVAVDVPDSVAVVLSFRSDHMLDEPRFAIDVLVPGHPLSFDGCPMIAEDVVVAVTVEVSVNHAFHVAC